MKIILAVILIALASPSFATPGRLNSCGCHNSKKVGYHCHKDLCQQTKKQKSKNKAVASLRFPTFEHFRDDKTVE